MSPFNFHEPQSRVFSPCMHFTGYFSWISGPGFQPLWAISTFIFSYPLTPRTSSLSTASFTRTALQVTLGISANLSWTHSQTHHKTWDPEISSHTSLFWTLPEQLQVYSNRCKYIPIYSNILSTNPDTHLANARERCWRQHRNKVKTARPGE